MKLIVAGGRDVTKEQFDAAVDETKINAWRHQISELVNGMCRSGVDKWAREWAGVRLIKVKPFPADWGTFGKAAGPIRNRQMAKYADGLIAIWDGKSPGTKNMIEEMEKVGKPVYVVRTDGRVQV